MSRGICATLGPGFHVVPVPPCAYGFGSALAVVVFPVVHSFYQSGSPPVTGTVPTGV